MNTYANGFYCAFGGKSSEAIIEFFQEYPQVEDGVTNVARERVGGFVLSQKTALDLAKAIIRLEKNELPENMKP